jgi:hypothetical protein
MGKGKITRKKKKKTIEPSMKQLKTSQINDSTHQTNLDAKNDSILRTHARRPPSSRN